MTTDIIAVTTPQIIHIRPFGIIMIKRLRFITHAVHRRPEASAEHSCNRMPRAIDILSKPRQATVRSPFADGAKLVRTPKVQATFPPEKHRCIVQRIRRFDPPLVRLLSGRTKGRASMRPLPFSACDRLIPCLHCFFLVICFFLFFFVMFLTQSGILAGPFLFPVFLFPVFRGFFGFGNFFLCDRRFKTFLVR